MGRPYSEQLAMKAGRLALALDRYPHLELPLPRSPVGSDRTEGYRHRLKLPVSQTSGEPAIGLYSRDGTRVLDTPDCGVLEPRLRDGLSRLRSWLTGHGEVHSVDLRLSQASGNLQLVLACRDGELRGGRGAASSLLAHIPHLTSIAVSRADRERKRVMGAQPRVIAGEPALEERIGATAYRLHPGAFFQADPTQAERLHALVRNAVGTAQTVLDLYSGVGAYALMLAPGRRRVIAVEEVPQAAASARAMAPRNLLVETATVEEWELKSRGESFDVCILNPARRGSSPSVLATIARVAKRLVYVSCGPESLARDLDILAAHGMRANTIQPIDLFPQTPEVETVVTLERGPATQTWKVPGGHAFSPWGPGAAGGSGAVGRASQLLVLAVGDTGASGEIHGQRFRRVGIAAGHSLVRVVPRGTPEQVLQAFARAGHPLAGADGKTAAFFAEKGGLLRPFLHVERAGGAEAPLHGDLSQCLALLRAEKTRGGPDKGGARTNRPPPSTGSAKGPKSGASRRKGKPNHH